MKILCVGDVHWSQNSSIVRSRGEHYSVRLENLIHSVNWAEETGWNLGCNVIIYLGDFFDSAVLNNEEISALREISWAPIPHIFITGNHETNVGSLEYSTCEIFNLCPHATVINKPECYHIDGTDVEFAFLPYIVEKDRQPLTSYFAPPTEKRIIFSHNDLKDVQYGPFLSTEGFTISEIESYCDLFINGHIHHCAYVTNKIINAGNLTGQNFTEDATKYGHHVEFIDTNTMNIQFYRNPFAFNFYKTDVTHKTGNELKFELTPKCDYAVTTVKVKASQAAEAREYLDSLPKTQLVEYRLIVDPESTTIEDTTSLRIETVDHLKQFENYVLENIGDTNLVREELNLVMR